MKFASEYTVDIGDQTQFTASPTATQHSFPAMDYLVVIRKNNQIVEIFRPQENHFTIGRSSKNSITLPDPRFPRIAGEIILGPIPILRKENNKKKNDSCTSIPPGKPYYFRPYTLTLLEPGEIIVNRHKNNSWSKLLLSGIVSLAIFYLGARFTISQFQGDLRPTATQEHLYSLAYSNDENRPIEKNTESIETINHGNIGNQTTFFPEKAISSEPIPISKVRKKTKIKISPDKIGSATTTNQQTAAIGSKARLYEHEIEKAIKMAELSIQRGNLVIAGRILNPLLPHADKNHRKKIIDTLDPYIETIFKEAYMLRFYEPGKSCEMLQNIADSGFKILPSYRKAVRSLEEIQSPLSSISYDTQ